MRVEGWEARLAAVVARVRHEPYVYGVHDCFRLACYVIEALKGVDRWPEFAGTYSNKREALEAIAKYNPCSSPWSNTFVGAAMLFFAVPPVPQEQARRGDMVVIRPDGGELHLGLVWGRSILCCGEVGLVERQRAEAIIAWPVG